MFSQNNPPVIGFGLVWKHKKYAKTVLMGVPGGGGGMAAAPQFVGQTKSVGQYSLHSWAILTYYKNKWDKFCQFCGKFCQFCGNMLSNRNFS